VAEKVSKLRRLYPKAMFAALLTAGAVYVLISIASSVALATDELGGVPMFFVKGRGRFFKKF
jgi:APA family basic amino acid/polyamine antiporter